MCVCVVGVGGRIVEGEKFEHRKEGRCGLLKGDSSMQYARS